MQVYRWQRIAIFLLSTVVLCASFYFQYVQQLQPCPLCIMQRICVILSIILAFISIYKFSSKGAGRLVFWQIIVALGGLFFATRQLWLQSLPPDQTPACLPELNILLQYFPWQDTVHALFWGSGDCAEVKWRFLGLSMPAWTSIYFAFIVLVNGIDYYRIKRMNIKT